MDLDHSIDVKRARVVTNHDRKFFLSPEYNYVFDKRTGFFARWGKTKEDDPDYSQFGPEILDIEVTTQCKGPGGKVCPFCYKSNTPNGKNMSFETFKTIFDKMPISLTQVAFGADSHATSNPDLFKMMEYCRFAGIIPNITVADISNETADSLASLCGAVACSRYSDKNFCYDSVQKLVDRGMDQVNIHMLVSQETLDQAYETINDRMNDERLEGLNAIVFLSLKKKGRGVNYNILSQEQFSELVLKAIGHEIKIGMDSCSAHKTFEALKDHENFDKIKQSIDPCESTAFSYYIDVNGIGYPCSFSEGAVGWKDGLDIVNCKNFVDDIWNHPRTIAFREKLISCNRNCPLYEV